jgi:outer membrane protein OmpA-like peptidoglycan-associated protein
MGVSLVALMTPAAFAQTAGKPAAPKPMATPPAVTQPAAPQAATQAQAARFMVFFDWDKATLTPEARKVIATAADEFKKGGAARIVATGHTDTSGSAEYNQKLSERRAQAVAQELVRLGVPAGTITTVGKGQNDLLVPTKDGVREAQNRRVVIEIPRPPAPPKPVAAAPAPAPAAPPPPPPLKWAASLGPWYGYNLSEGDGDTDHKDHLVGPQASISYYAAPSLPITLTQAGYSTIGTSSNDGYGGRTTLGVDYEGAFGSFRPFIGAVFGGIYGKGVQDGLLAGPELGAKLDVTRNWYLYGKAGYDYQFRNDLDEGIINGGLGAGYRF